MHELAPLVLLATGSIVLGAAAAPKPAGFIAIACGVLAIISAALHWPV